MNTKELFKKKRYLNIKGELYSLECPKVMGILNITEDSFYDGGNYTNIKEQLYKVGQMLDEGADFIDLGAQSTRPGAKEIGADDELKILLPTIKSIRKEFPDAILSIDTWYSEVAKAVYNEGADIINDISGGKFDPNMYNTIAEIQLPYILMHTSGKPDVMQNNTSYKDVVMDIIKELSETIDTLNKKGVNDIIIDPGFGFGKTINQNFEILKNLNLFEFLETPILTGLSRKSMIYKTLNTEAKEALNGTTALNMISLEKGSDILRVHDVKEAKECIMLYKSLYNK